MSLKKPDELALILDIEREKKLSYLCDLSQVQDSFRVRSERRALLIAQFLIDDKGELRKEPLSQLLQLLEESGQIFYAFGPHDALLLHHQIKILKKLAQDPAFYKTIKRFQKPLCHRGAEGLIRETFLLSSATLITDADIRRAVLSACLTLLRQNVGSCFATAPGIIIHEEQLDNFLADLLELLSTGKLKRTFAGVEHSVPLSPSSGVGDLKKYITSMIAVSPGLRAGIEAAGITFREELVTPYLKRKITVEDLIRELLLSHFRLKKSDVGEETLMIRGPFSTGDIGSKKRDLLDTFFKRERCQGCFQGHCG